MMKTVLKQLPIECLQPGQYQPRQTFDEDTLADLAQSIQTQGLIEPLVVREIAKDRYEIIAGERRWRASMMAKLNDIPCLIGQYSDSEAAAITLIENIQRQDLNLLEEARGYQRLHTEFFFHQDEIATLVGKSRSHIANMMRLLTLCKSVQERLCKKQLTLGHARMLVCLSPANQEKLAKMIYEQDWSVRRLEEEVRALKCVPESIPERTQNTDITYLEHLLSEQVGSPVQISTTSEQGGWLKIKFFDNDTLTGLLERMGLRYD